VHTLHRIPNKKEDTQLGKVENREDTHPVWASGAGLVYGGDVHVAVPSSLAGGELAPVPVHYVVYRLPRPAQVQAKAGEDLGGTALDEDYL
jgi:hypothetical protein